LVTSGHYQFGMTLKMPPIDLNDKFWYKYVSLICYAEILLCHKYVKLLVNVT
jgi:hypothetical protein